MKIARVLAAVLLVSVPIRVCTAAEPDGAGPALNLALAKCAEHADEWLAAKDFRSLNLAGTEAVLLAELLKSCSDDTLWQQAADKALAAARSLQTAARQGNTEQSRQAAERLSASTKQIGSLKPVGKSVDRPVETPNLRTLMRLVDGVYADAKVSLLQGNVADAKTGSRALAELAKLVSNARNTDGWAEMAGDLRQASLDAALSSDEDKTSVRQRLRAINERCDACHNAQ